VTAYQIIEATPAHVLALRDRLRADDREEITCVGGTPARALWRSYRGSVIRRTFMVDGEIAAIGGCGGSVLAGIGQPWLLTAPEVERVPVAMVREGRAEIRKMLELFPRLENIVAAKYGRACKWLGLLGFELGAPFAVGPQRAMFRQFWMER
jgi:hypothetical protein